VVWECEIGGWAFGMEAMDSVTPVCETC
jgi:hypothetical protein